MGTRTGLRRFAALGGRGPGTAPASGLSADAAPAQSSLGPAAVIRLRAIAKNLARLHGDWMPSDVAAFATTYAKALPFLTPGECTPMPSDAPVYLVTMDGRFGGPAAATPRASGQQRPETRHWHLAAVVDAQSFRVAGTGLHRRLPTACHARLTLLGQPASLTWYAAKAAC